MTNTKQYPADPMIKARSTLRGKNSKGGDRTQLYFSVEEVNAFISALTAAATSPNGVKLDIHTSQREAQDSGRKFDSTILFVRGVQESVRGAGPVKAVPRAPLPQVNTAATVSALRSSKTA